MALISSRTIITSLSLFHLTLAFFFVTSPRVVDDQGFVWVIGESMGLPAAPGFDVQSPQLAFAAALLAFMAISDLVSLGMPEEVCLIYHWGSQAPIRALLSMGFVFYSFFLGPSSPLYRAASPRGYLSHPSSAPNPSYVAASWGGDMLKNRVLFAFMFLEMAAWFWAWINLREERDALVARMRDQEAKRL
ncbi:hypothetical protein N3K66_000046 [Trichothecium roseum]|uniref:Uncharacterized protein n=1 Tax=Trichothecium roseum TaxID=47278 RepID=A0ACC0VCA1_9HYPO|nr:hypothetical protein N3K66_000046 [Trichothecium roseum]